MNACTTPSALATIRPPIRIPRRYAGIVFALLMSTSISALMSAAITLLNTGWDAGFAARWLHAYALSWSMAFPIVATVAPRVRQLVDRLTA
jgi:Protein of unknown function (DUF2798)